MIVKIKTVDVGSLPITLFTSMEQAVSSICSEEGVLPGFAVAINAEKVISARNNPSVKSNLMLGSLLYADGIAIVKTLAKKGIESSRIPGCELWQELMKKAAKTDKNVYLLGAKEEINRQTADKLKVEYGLENLTRRNGYYSDEQEVINDVIKLKPDIVTVALGSPKQELLITKMRKVHPQAFYMGVGGSYDVFVGAVKRAPKWAQKVHMEWLYRLLSQPKRIFRQTALIKYLWLHFTNKL